MFPPWLKTEPLVSVCIFLLRVFLKGSLMKSLCQQSYFTAYFEAFFILDRIRTFGKCPKHPFAGLYGSSFNE